MNLDIVIARYNESVDWVQSIDKHKTIIYNKGQDKIENAIILDNIGRETHTYFYHIVSNYDNLSDWTFFTQGKPFDHVRDFLNIIDTFPNSLNRAKINNDNGCYFFVNGHFNSTLESFSDGSPHHFDKLNIDDLWSNLFTSAPPKKYLFTAGCIFLVSKEQILNRSKDFYEKCLEITKKRHHAPWEFERMMNYVFKNEIK